MTKTHMKWLFLTLLFIAAIIGGLYLSGYILLMWLHLQQVPLELGTYLKYFNAINTAKVAPFASKIKISGMVGFGLPIALYLMMLMGIFKNRKQATHGESRFASAGDLAKEDMFTQSETAIVIGKMNGKIVYYKGQQFAILAAPTRSGKGVGVVIPNLLSYLGSMVVLD